MTRLSSLSTTQAHQGVWGYHTGDASDSATEPAHVKLHEQQYRVRGRNWGVGKQKELKY